MKQILSEKEFRDGQKVIVEIDKKLMNDAKLAYDSVKKEWFVCQNEMAGSSTTNKLGYKHCTEFTVEELDNLSLGNSNKQFEYYFNIKLRS